MKFAANLSTMFPNFTMVERYQAAADLGFKAVETQYIPEIPENHPDILKEAKNKANVSHVLLNSHPGDHPKECGFAVLLHGEEAFYNSISRAIGFCFSLGVKKIHILSGIRPKNVDENYLEEIFVDRFQRISEVLDEHLITGLIEPLCPKVKENYYLSSFEKAIELLKKIDRPNIKLLLDVFHLQEIEGSVQNLEDYLKYAGHVQVSQSPSRNELDSDGAINYKDVLSRLERSDYKDYVGLEYYPTNAARSLAWMNTFGYDEKYF